MHTQFQPEGIPSCDQNNCRCGNSQNCMYYNDNQYGHHNYTSVHGTGSPEMDGYRCTNAAYDNYNAQETFDDHALGGLGTYNLANEYGEVNMHGYYGPVDYPNRPICGAAPEGQDTPKCKLDQMEKPMMAQMAAHAAAAAEVAQDTVGGFLPMGMSPLVLAVAAVAAYLGVTGKLMDLGNLNQTDLMISALVALVVFFFSQ